MRNGLPAAALAVGAALAGCQTTAGPDAAPGSADHGTARADARAAPADVRFPTERYAGIGPEDGQVFTLDAQASRVAIHVYRGGRLAALGHSHVVVAGDLQGAVYLPHQALEQARFDLVVPLDALVVDPPEPRRQAGAGFSKDVPEAAREATRRNMLGAAVLDAARYPRLGISSLAVAGELSKLVLTVAITLRGVTREQLVAVDVRLEGERLVAQGAFAVRQRDFGIEPLSAVGGQLQVQDALSVEFRLVGHAAGPAR